MATTKSATTKSATTKSSTTKNDTTKNAAAKGTTTKSTTINKKETGTVKKELNRNDYIHIDSFFSKKNIESKYYVPFMIFMKGRTYQHSIEDFDKYFNKFLNRFNG